MGGSEPVTGFHSVMDSLRMSAGARFEEVYHIPRLGQSCETTKYDDAEHRGGADQQPMSH